MINLVIENFKMVNLIWLIPWLILLILLFVIPFTKLVEKFPELEIGIISKILKFFKENIDYILDLFLKVSEALHKSCPLRVPIISGLILFSFPLIAQWGFPKFLQNLFVMESNIQLILVMVFTFLTAMIIISLGKILIDLNNLPNGFQEKFKLPRVVLIFILCSPTWLVLLLNKEPDIKWYHFGLGILFSLLFLLLYWIDKFSKTVVDKLGANYGQIENLYNTTKTIPLPLFEIVVGLIFYVLAIYLNWPQPDGKINIWNNWQFPTLLYVLLIIWILTLMLAGIIQIFDEISHEQDKKDDSPSNQYHFHWPVILLLIIFSASAYGAFQVDHYFKLKDSQVAISDYKEDFKTAIGNRLCPEDFQTKQSCEKEQSLVVVAASGGGIQASGWTAQVLAGLQDQKLGIGEDFTKAIGLISSTSGGSVGTMFYLDQLNEQGILSEQALKEYSPAEKECSSEETKCLTKLVQNATDDWLDSVAWGLAYPDLVRVTGFPWFNFNKYLDRGYALEKDWQRTLTPSNLTLDDWYNNAKQGEIPIPVFNATLVENGRRFLISPMKFIPGQMKNYLNDFSEPELSEQEKQKIKESRALDFRTLYNCGTGEEPKGCNLDVMTAARLSASFPYVSPMARNDRDNKIKIAKEYKPILQNYHIADGGYFDNSGEFTAIEWLDEFLEDNAEALKIKKVVLVQISAFQEVPLKLQQKGNKGFLTVITGPFDALSTVRDSTQIDRNIQAVELLKDYWNGKKIMIKRFGISFPKEDQNHKEYVQPLSWQLSQHQKDNLKDAWENDETIRKTVSSMKEFWCEDKMNSQECEKLS